MEIKDNIGLKSNDINNVLKGAFGNPIIFDSEPTNLKMKGNTWGKHGSVLYVKFVDGVGLKFTGTTF